MAICNSLYNNMKYDNQISNLIVGLLLELKEVVHSIKKHLIMEHLLARIDNCNNLFTSLKDNNITNIIKPLKISHKHFLG